MRRNDDVVAVVDVATGASIFTSDVHAIDDADVVAVAGPGLR